MIIVLKPEADGAVAKEILDQIERLGCRPLHMPGAERVVLGALGDERVLGTLHLENHPMVERVQPILSPYKLVSREMQPDDTVVEIGGVPIGGGGFTVIAGPCAVESLEQFRATAEAVKAVGAPLLRGGAFKPRTSPYSFQGSLKRPGCRRSPRSSRWPMSRQSRSGLPVFRSVPATCRTSGCCGRSAGAGNRSCSSVVWRPRSTICCWPRNTS